MAPGLSILAGGNDVLSAPKTEERQEQPYVSIPIHTTLEGIPNDAPPLIGHPLRRRAIPVLAPLVGTFGAAGQKGAAGIGQPPKWL